MTIMILGYTFVFLFAVSLVASDGLPEIDSGVAGLWKLNGCRMDEPSPSFVRSNSLPVPEHRIIYSEDGDTKVFKWIRKQDGGEMSGNIYHTGDQWSSDCNIDKEANSEVGRQIQQYVAGDCDKVISMYYIGNDNVKLLQLYSNGFCSYNRLFDYFRNWQPGSRYGK